MCKRVGEMYSCNTLVDTANNFIIRNFEEVFRQNSEDFCRQVESVDELKKWFSDDSLFVSSEDFLLKVIAHLFLTDDSSRFPVKHFDCSHHIGRNHIFLFCWVLA